MGFSTLQQKFLYYLFTRVLIYDVVFKRVDSKQINDLYKVSPSLQPQISLDTSHSSVDPFFLSATDLKSGPELNSETLIKINIDIIKTRVWFGKAIMVNLASQNYLGSLMFYLMWYLLCDIQITKDCSINVNTFEKKYF